MPRFILSIVAAALMLLLTVSATLAVPLHQHVMTTPSGHQVWIAQGICKNDLQTPIDNLHANVHLGAPGSAFASNPIGLVVQGCP